MTARSTASSLWLRLLLSLVISAALLAVLVQQIEVVPRDLGVPPWVLPSYLATLGLYFLGRAGRWYFLLRPLGELRWSTATLSALAGIMWIVLLPLRLGELARPIFVSQNTAITASRALGTVALERVVDGLVVCLLFFVSFAWTDQAAATPLVQTAFAVVSLFTIALLVLAGMARWPHAVGRAMHWLLAHSIPPMAARIGRLAEGIAEGLRALPSTRPLVPFCIVTLLYWGVNVLGTWLLAIGCGLPLQLAETAALVSVINIVLLVPAGPAQVGNFHAGAVVGLGLFFGASTIEQQGSVFIFYLYGTQILVAVALGLWAQRRLRLDWRSAIGLGEPDAGEDRP